MKLLRLTLIFAFLFFLFTNSTFSQDKTGYLRLKMHNAKKPLCKINDSLSFRINDTTFKLSPGKYNVKVWMPTTTLIDTTVAISDADSTVCVFKIRYTPEYSKHLVEVSKYRFLQKKRYFLPPVYIGLSIGAGILLHTQGMEHVRKARIDRLEYSGASSQVAMDNSEESFQKNKKSYKRYIAGEMGMYTLAGVFAVNYVRLLIKQKRTVPPLYKEEKLLSRIQFNAYPEFAEKKCMVGLSMKF